MKTKNPETILTVKIFEWRKLINYIGLPVDSNPSSLGKKNVYFVCIGSISNPLYEQLIENGEEMDSPCASDSVPGPGKRRTRGGLMGLGSFRVARS